jgi:hypothetical protein
MEHGVLLDSLIKDGLWDAAAIFIWPRRWRNVSSADQDELAATSYRRGMLRNLAATSRAKSPRS